VGALAFVAAAFGLLPWRSLFFCVLFFSFYVFFVSQWPRKWKP
jgi:hypothetical protein